MLRLAVRVRREDAELVLAELIDLGIDGVYSDHVDRMVDAVLAAYPEVV